MDIRTHLVTNLLLQDAISAPGSRFASQRIYGYALSQKQLPCIAELHLSYKKAGN
jgi:hypothetical protein